MLLLDYKSCAGCFQHGASRRATLSRAHLLKAVVFLFPHEVCSSCLHLYLKLPAQVRFSSSLNQTVEYLQMKGCTSQNLIVDIEGVIVSPSADLRFNRTLSAGSHAKARAALNYLKKGQWCRLRD